MFGKVVDGMLTLRKIENVPTGQNSRPKLDVRIIGPSFLYLYLSLQDLADGDCDAECGEM